MITTIGRKQIDYLYNRSLNEYALFGKEGGEQGAYRYGNLVGKSRLEIKADLDNALNNYYREEDLL